ncbi:MAG: radical SAM protein, partial [Spirochaetaceae bacterium]|nr:radical SAM protein [Spirochaetaceae bacterium]
MRALLVQPPLVQLNAPYPAVHYLEAFLRARGHESRARDHSIELSRSMFSRAGLGRIFADARARLADGPPAALEAAAAAGEEPRRGPNEAERRELERYLSYEGAYLAWIDSLVGFLAGEDPALAHRIAAAAELPRGARAAAFLEERGGRIGPDEARALATRVLEDLADFVRFALDPEFGTVRYGERLARSSSSLSGALAALRTSYALEAFYRPWLRAAFAAEAAAGAPDILLVTLPFPGCLLGALACAEEFRKAFG